MNNDKNQTISYCNVLLSKIHDQKPKGNRIKVHLLDFTTNDHNKPTEGFCRLYIRI